jgi:hypothetical protein
MLRERSKARHCRLQLGPIRVFLIERLWNISQHLMCTRKAAKGCDEKIFVAQCSYPVDFLSPGSGLTRSADPPLAVVSCDGKRQSDVP